jgi:curved DNA-binding protein
MAVEFKDYYAVLGISRDATPDDIKKAFRKLARQYHPDVAKDKKNAEAKFKEINEAHEVLSDPDKRQKYDELGPNWQAGGHEPPPGAQRRGRPGAGPSTEEEYHFGGTGFSDFFEQFFGARGRNADADDSFRDARRRGGRTHDESDYAARGSDIEGDILVTLDEVLQGSTRAISLQRVDPNTGERETEKFSVRIPPGAQEGRRIRVPQKGGPGIGGGEAGDLFLRVRLAAHPNFEARGSDLHHDLEVAPWEAVLGTQVVVPTLSGSVKLRVPAGAGNGQQLRVRGQGLPKGKTGERGDLYVTVSVQMPAETTVAEHELWEKLAEISTFNPRKTGD